MLQKDKIDEIIKIALKEDITSFDITTDNIFGENDRTNASILAKEEGVIAGIDVFKRVVSLLDESAGFVDYFKDGDMVKKGDLVLEVHGKTIALLKAERTALNFLQRMSGIATLANKFCKKIEGLPVRVADTRKTTPGLRYLEKYAVKIGGCTNHRYNLSDGVLIKDNHIKACGGIKNAVDKVRNSIPHTIKIEVETESLADVQQAIEAQADIIMLDNMNTENMKAAVELIAKRAMVEASGNVTLDNILDIAKTGVDIISVGALTHSFKALDLSMRIQ